MSYVDDLRALVGNRPLIVVGSSVALIDEAGRLLLEDEKRFIDLARSPLWWGEEKTIIE